MQCQGIFDKSLSYNYATRQKEYGKSVRKEGAPLKDYGLILGSAEQAKELIVGTDTVYVHSDIEEITGENGEILFRYYEIQYGKDEYIKLISERNIALQKQITDTQLALCEVYELVG